MLKNPHIIGAAPCIALGTHLAHADSVPPSSPGEKKSTGRWLHDKVGRAQFVTATTAKSRTQAFAIDLEGTEAVIDA
jgi:hypothetical protein